MFFLVLLPGELSSPLIFHLLHLFKGVKGPQIVYFLDLLDRIHLYVFEDYQLIRVPNVSLLLHEFFVDVHDFRAQLLQRVVQVDPLLL